MNDPATLAGTPRPLRVGGGEYLIHPLTFEDLGRLQVWLEAQFPDPLEVVRDKLDLFSAPVQKHLLTQALEIAARPKPRLGSPEADKVLLTPDGFAEMLFLSIGKGDPSFTRERARELFLRMNLAEAAHALRLSGADLVVEPPPDPKAPTATTPTASSTTTSG